MSEEDSFRKKFRQKIESLPEEVKANLLHSATGWAEGMSHAAEQLLILLSSPEAREELGQDERRGVQQRVLSFIREAQQIDKKYRFPRGVPQTARTKLRKQLDAIFPEGEAGE